MTQREKVLAALVGGSVGLFLLLIVFNNVRAGFEAKNDQIDSLQKQVMANQTTITQGALSRKKINELALRSLPSNLETAKTAYNEWLIKFAGESKLSNAKPTFTNEIQNAKKPFTVLTYRLEGDARLDDVVRMMYQFHAFPYLHKITGMTLSVKPRSDYGVMEVKMDIAVAVLRDANEKQSPPKPEDYKLLAHSADEYLSTIVQRNIFFPANQPPRWASTASASANKGSPLSYELNAKDADEKQSVRYELVSSTASGARIEGNRLVWSPQELGKYEVTVRAIDSGLPAASSEQKIAINVADPPAPPPPSAPKPKFDVATKTFVTALLSGSKGPEAWFNVRTEGKMITVRVGDDFDVAGIKGKVTAIGSTFVELETDGRRWIIGQDESLADAYRRSDED